MLARLEALEGVERAETDFAGDLLRLSLRDEGAVALALERLASLGYGAEPTDVATDARWYDRRTVGELSRVEAEIIAARVTARFTDDRGVDANAADRVRAAVTDALHACFLTTELRTGPGTGEFRARCVERTVAAVRPIVGDAADALGRLLDDDMRHVHRGHR